MIQSDDGGRTWNPSSLQRPSATFGEWFSWVRLGVGLAAVWDAGEGPSYAFSQDDGNSWRYGRIRDVLPECGSWGSSFVWDGRLGVLCTHGDRDSSRIWVDAYLLDLERGKASSLDVPAFRTEPVPCDGAMAGFSVPAGGVGFWSACGGGWMVWGWPERGEWSGLVPLPSLVEAAPDSPGIRPFLVAADGAAFLHLFYSDWEERTQLPTLFAYYARSIVGHAVIDLANGKLVAQERLDEREPGDQARALLERGLASATGQAAAIGSFGIVAAGGLLDGRFLVLAPGDRPTYA